MKSERRYTSPRNGLHVQIKEYPMTSLCRFLFSGVLIFGTALTPISVFGQALSDPAVLRREFQKPQNNQLTARCQLVTSQLKALFPKASVRVFPEGDRIVVQGRAANTSDVERILTIVKCSIAPSIPQIEIADNVGVWLESHVVNRMTAPQQQVMLHVTIYRMNGKQLAKSRLSTSELLKDATDAPLLKTSAQTGWLAGVVSKDSIDQLVAKLEQAEAAHAVAAPSLTVASGHSASFLAGGEFPVPTLWGVGNSVEGGNQQTSFKGSGTSLLIKPDVVDEEFVRLDITLELSRVCPNTINGAPHLDAHHKQATAQMRSGQVVAIGGIDARLADNNSDQGIIRTVAGRIASSVRREKHEQPDELLILIRPEIIQQETAVRVSTNQPSATEWSTKHAILRRTTPSR